MRAASINVGLLGAGFMGSTHASAYARIDSARLVAVADANRDLAAKLAHEHHARTCDGIEALLDDPEVQAVDVCLPTFLHERCVVSAARHGKHILCEKPIALTIEEADRMIAATEQAGVIAMIGQVIRFWPEYVAMRELLQSGALGDVQAVKAARLSAPPAWGAWFKDPSLSGGALIDLHVHDLDFIYSLCGMPDRVFATGLQSATGAWDQVTSVLEYETVRAVAEGSFLLPDCYPFQMQFRLQGSKGTVEYRFRVAGQVGERDEAETELVLYRPGAAPEPVAAAKKDAYQAEIEFWVDCLLTHHQPAQATLRQARDVLGIAMAARRSLETGEIVALHRAAGDSDMKP